MAIIFLYFLLKLLECLVLKLFQANELVSFSLGTTNGRPLCSLSTGQSISLREDNGLVSCNTILNAPGKSTNLEWSLCRGTSV